MSRFNEDELRQKVNESYKKIAEEGGSCCSGKNGKSKSNHELALSIGYSESELASVPRGVNMGLGCGNPHRIAELNKGETVLDLGSGAGFDCFLASHHVGDEGHVIGVDMTIEMVNKARKWARSSKQKNMEFRLGEIENLPVADGIIDAIISNCVVNLSTNKQRVYNEMHRVLKSGGRIAVSDVILVKDFSEEIKQDEKAYCD